MADIQSIKKINGGEGGDITSGDFFILTWANMAAGDVGLPITLAQYADRSVQVAGTFDGATVVFEGTNDGVNYATLTDPQGNALSIISPKIEAVLEAVFKVRPRIQGGAGAVNITVSLLVRW